MKTPRGYIIIIGVFPRQSTVVGVENHADVIEWKN